MISLAKYNTGLKYNSRVNYNSASFLIIQVSDSGSGVDVIDPLSLGISINDDAIGTDLINMMFSPIAIIDSGTGVDNILHIAYEHKYNTRVSYNTKNRYNVRPKHVYTSDTAVCMDEAINIKNTLSTIIENGSAEDAVVILATPAIIEEFGTGKDKLALISNINIPDTGSGIDNISKKEYPAKEYFIVTTDSILNPLGVIVLGDSRKELLPSTRDNTEEIPGMHGEFDFGTELKSRLLELHVATPEGLSPLEKEKLRRKIAMYLNPVAGTKKLIFQDDEGVQYEVKYAGRIDPTNHPTWFEFAIPFKMCKPLIGSTEERSLVGSGVIVNEGTFETGLIIEISGPVTNPSLTIGTHTLSYNGAIGSGQKLIVDTFAQTAKIGSTNALDGWNGIFPLLDPGSTVVTAGSNVTIKWTEKYL